MINRICGYTLLVILTVCFRASAVDYRVEPLAEGPPADQLAGDIAKLISPQGIRVIRGTSRKLCDIWLLKQWPLQTFDKAKDVNYPFTPGQLIGVAVFHNKGSDFRDQDIGKGVYTLRYSQQPVDGAHVGTSPTRDFLLLVRADQDQSAAVMKYEPLAERSAEAAETAHPCLLSLQAAGSPAEKVSIREKEGEDEWWIVSLKGSAKAGSASKVLAVELVVVGHAVE